MKNLILLDIDNTIYNSKSFRESLFDRISRHADEKVKEEVFKICYELYDKQIFLDGVFDYERFLKDFEKKVPNSVSEEMLISLILDEPHIAGHLHKEAMEALHIFSSCGDIGILSQGETKLQQLKLSSFLTMLHPEKIYITRDKLGELKKVLLENKKYHTIFFVDDRLPILAKAKKLNKKFTVIWIKRGRHALSQKPIRGFKPDYSVTDLQQAAIIVSQQ